MRSATLGISAGALLGVCGLACGLACGRSETFPGPGGPSTPSPASASGPGGRPGTGADALDAAPKAPFVLHVIGTSDVHGHVESIPLLAGFVKNLRAKDGSDHVLLVDAGDMFQGTLESNLGEGASVVRAYNAVGYDAVAIGNHEFDFGPAGPHATPDAARADGGGADDPRGALKARAAEAKYPFLTANVEDEATGKPVDWPHVSPSVILDKGGIKVGLIGVTSEDTPRTTIAVNFGGLRAAPIVAAVRRESVSLRERGADVVVLMSHAGGKCSDLKDAKDTSSCRPDEEIMRALGSLPAGTVDAVVAGHTHQGMAQVVHGVPVVQSFSYGRAFGRIDLAIDPATKKITASKVFPPEAIAVPKDYEGRPVEKDEVVAASFASDVAKAKELKEARLGVEIDAEMKRQHDEESPVGNLLVDMMRAEYPKADVAIANGGGLRADIPKGPLTYGELFEVMPFDNKLAVVRMTGAELRALVTTNLTTDVGIFSLSGVRAVATCQGKTLHLDLLRPSGKPIEDRDPIVLATSDFLALGGDGTSLPKDRTVIQPTLLREAFEKQLRKRGGHLSPSDVFDPAKKRVVYPGSRPVTCR